VATNQGSGWRVAAGTGLGAFLGGPLGASLIGGGVSLLQNLWSAKRADSAHQREVRDMQRAGINPILTGRGPGAAVGEMQDIGRGVTTALEVRRARAEIAVLEAQARQLASSARESETRSNEISTYAPGRADEVSARVRLLNADEETRRLQLKNLQSVIESEIQQRLSSAAASKAIAALHRADLTRAENIAAFEKELGMSSPAIRLFFEVLRSLSSVRGW